MSAGDPEGRRRTLAWGIAAALAGLAAIAAFQHYRGALEAWLVADPARVGERARWMLIALAALIDLPLVAILPALWRRGRAFRILTAALAALCALLNFLLWRLAALLGP